MKKEEVLNVVNCYSLQLDICSYDKNDLRVKQLKDPKLSLVIDYFESVAKPKSLYLHYLKDLNHNCIYTLFSYKNAIIFHEPQHS